MKRKLLSLVLIPILLFSWTTVLGHDEVEECNAEEAATSVQVTEIYEVVKECELYERDLLPQDGSVDDLYLDNPQEVISEESAIAVDSYEVSVLITIIMDEFRPVAEKPVIFIYHDGVEVARGEMILAGYGPGGIRAVSAVVPENPSLLGEFSWRIELPGALKTSDPTSGVFTETSYMFGSDGSSAYGHFYQVFINTTFTDDTTSAVCEKCGEPGECYLFATSFTYTAIIELQMTFVRGSRMANETPVFIVYENGSEIRRENVKWITETIGVGDVLLGASLAISGFVCQQEELLAYYYENFNINDEWGTLTWRVELPSTIRALGPTSGTIGNVTFQSRNHHNGEEVEGYWYQITLNVERVSAASGNEKNNNNQPSRTSPQTSDDPSIILFLLLSLTSAATIVRTLGKKEI